ncbi:MAG: PH domain-containing protein, partial [Clostridia bacterium]|nr:PH domain-containing protein [Clostridia bacterium]
NYIGANLSKDEKVVASIKHSWVGVVPALICAAFLIIFGILLIAIDKIIYSALGITNDGSLDTDTFVIFKIAGGTTIFMGIWVLLSNIVEISSAQLVVTNKRLLGRRGFISKRTTDIMLNKVDTINAENGFWGAIFHYGTIQVVSPASGKFSAKMKYSFISNTMEFRKAVLDTIEIVKREEQAAQINAISQAIKMKNE